MSSLVADLVHDALDSFAARDADLAVRVTVRDKAVDDFYNSLFRTLVTFMMENPKHITESAHLLFVAKNLEHMGDHRSEDRQVGKECGSTGRSRGTRNHEKKTKQHK